jgi:L-lactate dehydrogenase complex protein LldG
MTSRESILESVRAALGRKPGQAVAPLPEARLCILPDDAAARIDCFVSNFERLGGKSFRVRSSAEVGAVVSGLLDGKHAVASNAPFLRECGVIQLPQVESGFTDRERLRAACAAAGVGITSADYVLADTGTLVMLSSAEEARLISLLPPAHLAIFSSRTILSGLDELLTVLPKPAAQTSSMVLITGPSRTADIEQILVRGVHGPGEIYAVIVEAD